MIYRFFNNEDENNYSFHNCCSCCKNANNNVLDTQNQLVIGSSYNGLEENYLNNSLNSSYNNYNGTYNCGTVSSNGTTARVNVIPNKFNRFNSNVNILKK